MLIAKAPDSADDWLALTEQHRNAAQALAQVEGTGFQAIGHAGFAVEAALKRRIMIDQRYNRWPDKSERRDLYTHDLRALAKLARLEISPSDPHAASWHIMSTWQRCQAYDPRPTPPKVTEQFLEAAFGENGIVTWLTM